MKHNLLGSVTLAALAVFGAPSAFCDSIVANQWYSIQWNSSVGVHVFNAPGYTSTSGTVLDDPGSSPWTFTAGIDGAQLIVTDLFTPGVLFSVFNGGSLLGHTSVPANGGGTCGNDPAACLNDPSSSHGAFFLAPGLSSISMMPLMAEAFGFTTGEAAFEIITPSGSTPEPGTVGLFLLGAAGVLAAKRRFVKR